MRLLKSVVAVGLLAVVATTGAQGDRDALIKYRQALMKAQSGHLGAMFQIASGKAGQQSDLQAHAHGLAEVSKMLKGAFKTATQGGKTKAKADIWKNWSDFEQKAGSMEQAAADVLAAVKSGDTSAVGAKLGDAGDTCKACHKKYRKR